MSYETSTIIEAPVGEVWSVLQDVERWPDWSPTMTWVRPVDEAAPGLVAGTRKRIKQPGLPVNVWTVRSVEPGRAFTWTTENPLVTVHADHELEAVDGGHTRVTLRIGESGPLAVVVRWAFHRANKRNVDTELESLKTVCEAGGGAGSSGRR